MANITVSIPEDLRKKMRKLDEVNWSAVSRKAIEEKIWKEEMLRKLEEEKEDIEWAVKLGREAKKGRAEKLKKISYKLS